MCYIAKHIKGAANISDVSRLDVDISANLKAAAGAITSSDESYLSSNIFTDVFFRHFPDEKDPKQFLNSISSSLS